MINEDKKISDEDKSFLTGFLVGVMTILVTVAIVISVKKDKKLSYCDNHTKNVFIVNNTCKDKKLKLLIEDRETQEVTWHSTNIKCKVF